MLWILLFIGTVALVKQVTEQRSRKALTMSSQKNVSSESLKNALTAGEMTFEGRFRHLFRLMPSNPRCKVCNAPFKGFGGKISSFFFNKSPSNFNPHYCTTCVTAIEAIPEGIEIELALFFADIRGSTQLGESLDHSDFRNLMNRFYNTASEVLIRHDAFIDKFVGDEVVALFLGGFTGPEYTRKAYSAALDLLRATGHGNGQEPWAPLGVGIHTGIASVGVVGTPDGVRDITALGDNVNIAARLASEAKAGEILLSKQACLHANLDPTEFHSREVELKGKSEAQKIWVHEYGRTKAEALR